MKERRSAQDEHLYPQPALPCDARTRHAVWVLSEAYSPDVESAGSHSAHLPGDDLDQSELVDPHKVRAVCLPGDCAHLHATPLLWHHYLRRYSSDPSRSAPGKGTAAGLPTFHSAAGGHDHGRDVRYFLSRIVRFSVAL